MSDFDRSLFHISNNLQRGVSALEPSANTFLHYCSLDAFYSIMDTGRIRFTSAKNTNDPSEFIFGQRVVNEVLQRLPEVVGGARGKLIQGCEERFRARAFLAFVFCMSEAVEDEAFVGELSQWRLYGADGRGVALVVRADQNDHPPLLDSLASIPRKVVYGGEEGSRLVAAVVEEFIESACNHSPECSQYILDNLTIFQEYLLNVVFWLPSVIKHKAYRHEREVRLVRGDIGKSVGNPLVFFDKAGIKRPAIEIPISKQDESSAYQYHQSPIEAVIIGPSGDQSAIEDSIGYFIGARSWDLDVRRSDIPYRAV